MKSFRLNLIPGDGIGVDVIREGCRVLKSLEARNGGIRFDFNELDWSCRYYLQHRRMMPEDGMQILADCDAILLGAVGFPGVPDHISLRELLLPIRVGFDQYVNLRPVRLLPGLVSPIKNEKIDFTVIRENSEGEYCGKGEIFNEGGAEETVVQNSVFTRKGTERIIRYAFEYAQRHGQNKVMSATKSNALNYSMVFWDKVFHRVAADYPDFEARQMHIDALAGFLIMHPDRLQVVVASNLFGDILTDLGSAMLGSIGISPSANINPERKYPSMFEPIHGSAPDIAGKGIADPVGTLWAIAMMLDHLGLKPEADLLMSAIESVLSEGSIRTPDIGGDSTTTEMTDAVIRSIMER
ncbi:MAG: tartrate dehydrogenase [Victivallaceae bacterium]|nr:tartrate dehydrogenase [Victivallaceae bacterium]